jgi:DNA-binding NtrC family response regulator
MSERILVVEDDSELRALLAEELTEQGYEVLSAADAESAHAQEEATQLDLVISDLRLPGSDGMALLEHLAKRARRPAFLMITAFGTIDQAMQAVRAGADDFLTKPLDIDRLLVVVARVLEVRRLRHQVRVLEELVGDGDFHGMKGASRVMRDLFDQVRMVARADGPVLLLGESGTGKEEVARALHAESRVADGPFQAVNCAGIPPDLFEAEFFGHEAGAFTGAQRARKGLFAEANGGTLLLDEIGELPLAMQAKLLRVMENGAIRPVGSNHERQVSVRVIAATHRDLESMIASGDFREDLYYRLESLSLALPPLRRRGEDIDLLAAHFMRRCAAAQGKSIEGFSEEAVRCLHRYDWPGNIRELHNVVQRAVTFCEGETIAYHHLPERLHAAEGGEQADQGAAELLDQLSAGPMLPTLDEMQQRYMRYVLEQAGGNKRRAAALLGIGRRTLYRWLGESDN